jgi:hypothetical protein
VQVLGQFGTFENKRLEDFVRENLLGSEETLFAKCPQPFQVNMSEIVAANVAPSTNETEQVIDDLQNVVIVDKAAKLAALQGHDPENSPAVEKEAANGMSDVGDKTENHHNGTGQNGDAVVEQTADTTSEDATNPVGNSDLAKESTEETPVEASSGTGTEECMENKSPKKSEQEESTNTESKPDAVSEDQTTKSNEVEVPSGSSDSTGQPESATSTISEAEVSNSSGSNKSPAKSPAKDAAAEQVEGDQVAVNKPVEEECSKASPGKKSCSPF